MIDPQRFRDFVANEQIRIRRFAEKLAEQGQRQSGHDLADIAEQLQLLGQEGMRPT